MHPDNDLPKLATCTTCRFKEDLSNYWTAVMYFKHQNGSYIRVCLSSVDTADYELTWIYQVPQMANQFTGSPQGGMTVYYIQPPGNVKVTSFKKVWVSNSALYRSHCW